MFPSNRLQHNNRYNGIIATTTTTTTTKQNKIK